jgi:biotin carboxylase
LGYEIKLYFLAYVSYVIFRYVFDKGGENVKDALLVLSSGSQFYREHALSAVAAHYPIVLFNEQPITWQTPYLLDSAVVALTQREALLTTVNEFKERYHFKGVLTHNEAFVEESAAIAEMLNVPSNSLRTAHLCRDKHLMRQAWKMSAVPSARSVLVSSFEDAQKAAAMIGYPVVLKPRGLAASVGVIRVDTEDALVNGYQVASINPHPSFRAAGSGLLVEEYLDGPEVSVECAVVDGQINKVAITRKSVGLAPGFEELEHVVAPGDALPDEAAVMEVVRLAHQALDVHMGITHAEVRLTPQGPRMIELGLRCAGDLIPYVVDLATGVNLYTVSAQIAVGDEAALRPSRQRAAALHFLYPPYDARVRSLSVQPTVSELPWIKQVAFAAHPGIELHLPPRGFLSRLGFVIVTASSLSECREHIEQSLEFIDIDLERLPELGDAQPRVAPRT